MINISKRIVFLSSLFDESDRVGDIGSDHGYLLFLLHNKGVKRLHGVENKKGPFENLKRNLNQFLSPSFTISLDDGINNLPKDLNTLCLSGMGGNNIISILKKGDYSFISKLVLSPHSHYYELREYLQNHNFEIVDEHIIKDDKYYLFLVCSRREKAIKLTSLELKYGPCLVKKRDPIFLSYIEEEINKKNDVLAKFNLDNEKIDKLKQEINELNSILQVNNSL